MAVTAYGQVFHGSVAPEETPVKVGSLWIDLSSTAVLKICTSISPHTFEEISGSGDVGGADTQVQFNDGGVLAGDAGLTFNKTTDQLAVAGSVYIAGQTVLSDSTLRFAYQGLATIRSDASGPGQGIKIIGGGGA